MENKIPGRVVILIPTLAYGGAERIASELSLNLPESIKQTLVLFENKITYPYKGNLFILGTKDSNHLIIKGLNLIRRIIRFRKITRHIKPDVVLSSMEGASYVNVLTKYFLLRNRHRTVIKVGTLTSKTERIAYGLYGFIHGLFVRFLYSRADKIIAASRGVAEDLITNFKIKRSKIDVIYSPVDLPKVQALSQEEVPHPWFSEDIPIIITVGRLEKDKNQADLLKAFAAVRKEHVCRLVLIGEGGSKNNLFELARDLNIENYMRLLGFQENPFKYVAKSTIFVLPSLYEGFGNVLLEAMAVGCPVISYDCPAGPREILAPNMSVNQYAHGIEKTRYGILIPVSDVAALSKAIKKLLQEDLLRKKYSELGVQRAGEFEMSKAIRKYLAAMN